MPRRGACRVCATERTRSVRNIRQPSCLINGIRVYHSARLGPHATAWCDRRIPYSAPSLLIDSRSGTRTYSCTRRTRTVSLPGGRFMFLFFPFRLVFLRFSLVLWKIIAPFNCLSHKYVRGFPSCSIWSTERAKKPSYSPKSSTAERYCMSQSHRILAIVLSLQSTT